jgi:hypothetical protein
MNLTVFNGEEKIFECKEKSAPEAYEEVRIFIAEYYKTNKGKLIIKEIEIVGIADENGLIWK